MNKFFCLLFFSIVLSGCQTTTSNSHINFSAKNFAKKCDFSNYKNTKQELISLMDVKYSHINESYVWRAYRNELNEIIDGKESTYQLVEQKNKEVVSKAIKLKNIINKVRIDIGNTDCTSSRNHSLSMLKELEHIERFLSSESGASSYRLKFHGLKLKAMKMLKKKEEIAAKKVNSAKSRKLHYSSLKSAQYQDGEISIKLIDFYDGTAIFLLNNLSQTKILTTNHQYCESYINEFGGEECLWLTKTIESKDEFGNRHQIYWRYATPIQLLPNEAIELKVPLRKTIPNVNIKLQFAKNSVGNQDMFILEFK